MIRYDQHMHTYFSPDSSETLEAYLDQTTGPIVTTEHLDFNDLFMGGEDTILDYEKYRKTIDQLNTNYNHRIRKGIEIGYTKDSHAQILDYLKDKEFDVQLLSVHQNGEYDFLQPIVKEKNVQDVMNEYFPLLLEALEQFQTANVLTHFDYGIRLSDVSVDELQEHQAILKNVLRKVIDKEMAFELNTRSMYQYGNVALYEQMIKWYLELGGKSFSLGSDAHSTDYYGYHFEDAITLLEEQGVSSVTIFEKQQPTQLPLNTFKQ
ncbi:histidinol-phosphatase HisJ family protein [Carnobacterium funditum]|uniref:histidinol-phosphatase HisJ family protein n=1 Tax=Carnobacterium funditum TaxID=2752 RepID=UPI0005571D9F|nr:histidinol-phosphatase HisJ family protein [Carnobacterium funditum]